MKRCAGFIDPWINQMPSGKRFAGLGPSLCKLLARDTPDPCLTCELLVQALIGGAAKTAGSPALGQDLPSMLTVMWQTTQGLLMFTPRLGEGRRDSVSGPPRGAVRGQILPGPLSDLAWTVVSNGPAAATRLAAAATIVETCSLRHADLAG
jgi:hypothetical protein